jgi:hypothetical protein
MRSQAAIRKFRANPSKKVLAAVAIICTYTLLTNPYSRSGKKSACQQPILDITDEKVLELRSIIPPDPVIFPKDAWLKPEAGMIYRQN